MRGEFNSICGVYSSKEIYRVHNHEQDCENCQKILIAKRLEYLERKIAQLNHNLGISTGKIIELEKILGRLRRLLDAEEDENSI